MVRVTYGYKIRDTGKWTYSSKLFGDRDTTSVEIGHDVAQLMSIGACKVTVNGLSHRPQPRATATTTISTRFTYQRAMSRRSLTQSCS